MEFFSYFSYFCSKHRLRVYVRTASLRRGGSNEYPQSMFWSKNKKIGIPLCSPVLLYESGVQGVYITRTCFRDGAFLTVMHTNVNDVDGTIMFMSLEFASN